MHAFLRLAAFAVLVGLAAPASAQAPAAGGWAPWVGCWRLVVERGGGSADEQPQVCVAEAAGGARLTTTIDGRVALERTMVADGVSRQVDDGDCRGTERHEWSARGLRLYTRAEVTCTEAPGPRLISGYTLLLEDGMWIDIQAVETNRRDSVRIRRYERVDSAVSPRPSRGRAIDLDDVKEASGKLAPAAIEAAIAESATIIRLSSKRLLELEAARVPERLIDLLVATAYPDRFVIDRGRSDRGAPFGAFHAYPDYYSPFGFSPYGWYDPFYYFPLTGSVVEVGGPFSGPASAPPSSGGRVVDGRGYTQVRPRDTRDAPPGFASGSSTGSASVSSASSSSSGSSSSSSSGGGGSASPSGFSGGGDGGGGRTAVPR